MQKQAFSQENIVDDHLWLLNTVLGETLTEIALYLKNRHIQFGDLLEFLRNPQSYPGNKITGLQQISEKFLQDIVSKYYFEIQANKLPVKFVYNKIIKALFQKGTTFPATSHITMTIRGGDDTRKAVCTSRIDELPRLSKRKNNGYKKKLKSKSKSKNKIIPVKISKTGIRGSCAYCSARAKFRPNGNTTHINISQTPSHHYFCSKECKNAWIFVLNEEISQED